MILKQISTKRKLKQPPEITEYGGSPPEIN